MAKSYKRPPITEAVVEFRISNPLDENLVRKTGKAFAAFYPNDENVQEVEVEFNTANGVSRQRHIPFVKRTSLDATEVVMVKATSLGVAQLAPYAGWKTFLDRVSRDWKIWRSKVEYRDLSRLGVRFINRLDIPRRENEIDVNPADYLRILPGVPRCVEQVNNYHVSVAFTNEPTRALVTMNTATVDSPLLMHMSILLDFDFGRTDSLPKREEELFELLTAIREEKNKLFEDCITDNARELFQ